jgi:peptidyl-prolyl cis-trans isomerase D
MLAFFRRFLDTWVARVFFVILVASFGLWGVADVVRNYFSGADDGTSVATVGSHKIDVSELQDSSRRLLAQLIRQNGGQISPTPEIRRGVAEQALQQLVIQAAFTVEAERLHLAVPDEAVRQATFANRAFAGPSGQFDRATFLALLRNNGLTEDRFVALMRTDIEQKQLVEAVRAGGSSPSVLNKMVYEFQGEKRVADVVSLPFAAAAQPPAPTDEQLQRLYADTANDYAAPELRRIKAVILSPETIAQDVEVSDDDLHTYYEQHKNEFAKPEQRSVQVIVSPTEAAARSMATSWIAGADWDTMQKQAAAANASAIELDDTAQAAFPAADLAAAVFDAIPNAVTGPIASGQGFQLFRVIKVTPGDTRSFDQVKAELKPRVALERAMDLVYDRANKVQDALASGSKLDELPTGLGLAAVAGTLDAEGNTPDGTPAPIPGSPALRAALIAHAFQTAPNDPPTLENGPDHSFYAVSVESITPPAKRPLAQVIDRVRDDWLRDARRHEQDVAATALMTAIEGGASIADAAKAAGVVVQRTPPIGRAQPAPNLPPELVQPAFGTAIGKPGMIEAAQGFWVFVPVSVTKPDPAADPAAVDRLRVQLAAADSDDLEMTFAAALRDREKVTVNRRLLDSVTQP